MTGASLLPLFLIACVGGYIAARPVDGADTPLWRAGIGAPAAVILVGASIAAAEAGSASARYVALFAVLIASMAAIMILGVKERRWPPVDGPSDDEDGA